jgi:hypothetical protein
LIRNKRTPVLLLSAGILLAAVAAAAMTGPASAATTSAAVARSAVQQASRAPVALHASSSAASSTGFELYNLNSHLCLGINKGADDSPAILWDCNGKPNQNWSGPTQCEGDYCQLVNGQPQCLGVAGGALENGSGTLYLNQGTDVVGWQCYSSHPDQYWLPEAIVFNEEFQIQDYVDVGATDQSPACVGVSAGGTTSGDSIVVWPCNGDANQDWEWKPQS